MPGRTVTLIGGTGFIGHALALRLARAGLETRIVSRRPIAAAALPHGATHIVADARDSRALAPALASAAAVVYLPGLVHGTTLHEFRRIHVDAANRCATLAARAGAARFVYVSALGVRADAAAMSDRTKAEGEAAVAAAFADSVVFRPSLVIGPGDHVLAPVAAMMRRTPVLPVIGPSTRIQPVHVDDLISGLEVAVRVQQLPDRIFEAAGPKTWTMLELLRHIKAAAGLRCALLPLPRGLALALAAITERLPGRPLVRDQVRLMATDKIATGAHAGLDAIGINARDPTADLAAFL
jgi:uncharacterized protein YbjT (DUF2867 family)